MLSMLRPSGVTAARLALKRTSPICVRYVSTLKDHPYIYVHKDPEDPKSSILSFLETEPPTKRLIVGTTTSNPPTPESFKENPIFRRILHSVIANHCAEDPEIKATVKALIEQSQKNMQYFRPTDRASDRDHPNAPTLSRHAFKGAGVGGWVHISDLRNPPDINRSPDPEDIFGSVECDGKGNFAGGIAGYQACESYRIITPKGMITLSDFLRDKLIERLKQREAELKEGK